jgi:hypothetical protein
MHVGRKPLKHGKLERRPNSTLLPLEPKRDLLKEAIAAVTSDKKLPHWAPKFLHALRDCVHLYQACKVSRVDRKMALEEREVNPTFSMLWDQALKEGVEKMETVLKIMAPSNVTALIFWLKAHDKKYRENIHFEIVSRIVERFVLDVSVNLKSVIPDNCPHCAGPLALGPQISNKLRELSMSLEKGEA